ncbi:c-type cytochrome [Stakelama pacifica]|uniref:Cytochrome c n=1 Tax=Stakelama pacifica TaxID=517720 RepID=A0A4R6FV10_9SPHN|nr:cytochrome c family protein [Stakelama pacifica]TDN85671.1 cytochrome c [Stakelama pacifica]GGO91975.1 cytochrome c [Stakelama pacifica]
MDNRTNTIAGWVLAACVAALGLSIVGGMIFLGHSEPEKFGYPVEGVETGGDSGPQVAPIATRLAAADAAAGEKVFNKCTACHTVAQGAPNGIGPNLWGTVGEEIGHGKRGFAFSDALASHGGKWTFENLDEWLMSPRKFAPGTKMTFAGLSDPQDRADVILYLNQHGSNLPLPAPPPPGATGGDNAGAAAANEGAANETGAQENAVELNMPPAKTGQQPTPDR